MNVLSLFDGMSCAMLALERAGIKVDNYYASELDKYAIKVSQANYPNIIQLGDINQWRTWDFPKIDLVIGGSPCQGFSFAGKQLAFDDPRSKLFFEYIAILRNVKCFNPDVKFLLENVKMKKTNLDIITEWIGVKPININSNLVSAQNRNRFYWCNWDVEQPTDKEIFLGDILEDGYGGYAYNRNDKIMGPLDKAYPLNATDWRGLNRNQNQTAAVCGAMRGRYDENRKTSQQIEIRDDGKTNALTTVQKDNLVCRATVQQNAEHTTDGKCPTLTASMGLGGGNVPLMTDPDTAQKYKGKYIDADQRLHYRRLTPIECERLQTVPDNYTNHVSNTQRYKMLGNGFTVDVIAHILGVMYG